MLDTNTALIYIGLFLIIAELIVGIDTGFDFLILGTVLIISGAIGAFFSNTQLGIVMSSVISVTYIAIGRHYIKKKLNTHDIPSNTDTIIGKKAIVTKQINPNTPGQIHIGSETWRASAKHMIEEGSSVTIDSISGVTAHVVQ